MIKILDRGDEVLILVEFFSLNLILIEEKVACGGTGARNFGFKLYLHHF